MAVELDAVEKKLRDEIAGLLKSMHEYYRGIYTGERNIEDVFAEMGAKAHALHMSLSKKGIPPKHHGYMLRNRRIPVDDPDFYVHVHPVEDLLKFLEDEHANDDPVDQTIGHEFTFRVYSRRWGHDDTYQFLRVEDGWTISFGPRSGQCDKTGEPFLFRILENDTVQYPHDLGSWLEWLWEKAASQGLSHEIVQAAIQELANWVSLTEKNTPTGGLWLGH